MHDPVSSATGFIPSQDQRPTPAARAGQLPRYLRHGRRDATPLLAGDHPISGAGIGPEAESETLADRYLGAEPIDVRGDAVYPLYSEPVSAPVSTLSISLLSAAPPIGLAGVGIGLSMVDGYIDLDNRYLGGVDIWRDALEPGITFDLSAHTSEALFTLTPVWADAAGVSQSWSGNYGIVVERTDTGRTVLWCSMGAGPPHFADLVIEIRSTPLDPYPQLFGTPQAGAVSDLGTAHAYSDADRNLLVDTAEQVALSAPGDTETEYRDAPHGYPASFADLVLAPGRTEASAGTGTGFASTGPHEPLAQHCAPPSPEVESDSAEHRVGRHAWVDHPETTGMVPTIRGTDLPDYGPEPHPADHPRAGTGPDPDTGAARTEHRAPPPDNHHDLADTVTDGSLTPATGDARAEATPPDPHRLHHLGAVAAARGDTERAGLLWLRAARAGNTSAAYDLGMLYLRHDDPDTAERWWRTAAGRRMIRAMTDLSELLEQRGATAEARMWRTQAAAEEVIAKAARERAATSGAPAQRWRDLGIF